MPLRPVAEIAPVEALRPKLSEADDDSADANEALIDTSEVIDGELAEDESAGAEIVSLDAFRKK